MDWTNRMAKSWGNEMHGFSRMERKIDFFMDAQPQRKRVGETPKAPKRIAGTHKSGRKSLDAYGSMCKY